MAMGSLDAVPPLDSLESPPPSFCFGSEQFVKHQLHNIFDLAPHTGRQGTEEGQRGLAKS